MKNHGIEVVGDLLLENINRIISEPGIVDTKIYDISNDTDGGVWSKDNRLTSWYTEELNTAIRGATREFPNIPVFGLWVDKLVIYDGAKSGVPMWAVITNGTNNILPTTPNTSVDFKNGKLVIGNDGGTIVIDFIADSAKHYQLTLFDYNSNIVNRNAAFGYTDSTEVGIVNVAVNDVTINQSNVIAVATDGGVSVIDGAAGAGTVIDSLSTGTVNNVSIDDRLYYSLADTWYSIAITDLTVDGFTGNVYSSTSTPAVLGATDNTLEISYFGTGNGLTILNENTVTPSGGMVAHITDQYNTGYMHGDIELTLSGDSLTDRSVSNTTVSGTATFALVNEGDLQVTTATSDLTTTVTTGGIGYGWEYVSGSWYFRKSLTEFVGASEATGTLTIVNGTVFTLFRYTTTTPTNEQFTEIEEAEAPLFRNKIKCLLSGSSNVTDIKYNNNTDTLKVLNADHIDSFTGLLNQDQKIINATGVVIDHRKGQTVYVTANDFTIEHETINVRSDLLNKVVDNTSTQQSNNSVQTIAELRETTGSTGDTIQVLGYYSYGDGYGGPLRIWKTGTVGEFTDNGGSIIVPTGGDGSGAWIWEYSGVFNVKWFGAIGDGTTDDSAVFNEIETTFSKNTINLNGGSYAVSSVPNNNVYINGNFVISGNTREAWGTNKVNKVEIAGLSPERISSTVLRIFPGYCSDGDLDPSEIIELTAAYDIDRTVSGLGGVDNGTYTANVEYFVYMLKNPDTGDVGAVLSREISTSLVTKPVGYTLIRKLPWGYISIGGGIPPFHISYWPLPYTRYTEAEDAAAWRVLSLGTATTFTAFDLSGLVPDNARMVKIMTRIDRVGNAGKAYIRTLASQAGMSCGYVPDIVGMQTFSFLDIRTTSAAVLYYKVDSGVRFSVYVLGYSQTERS